MQNQNQNENPNVQHEVARIARAYQLSEDAVQHLLRAVADGGGTQAQFSHPDVGGSGQWMSGGMVMVSDLFNHALKQKVDDVCNALSALVARQGLQSSTSPGAPSPSWWPADLGQPASTGQQNETRYAWFPQARRLVTDVRGRQTVYDTGSHEIHGFGQQQSGGSSWTFTSQHGPVALTSLKVIGGPAEAAGAPAPAHVPSAPTAPRAPSPSSAPPAGGADTLTLIERLAELKSRGIISESEFAAKKADLLSRL